jgi:holdfast attachment protein HfaA
MAVQAENSRKSPYRFDTRAAGKRRNRLAWRLLIAGVNTIGHPTMTRTLTRLALTGTLGFGLMAGAAFAGSSTAYSTASNYNAPYGMTAGEENAAINPSLRDSNGNLTSVNGQVTSANFGLSSSGVQGMSTISSSSLATSSSSSSAYSSTSTGTSGVGTSTATAIGNSLNVVTVGSNNTVIVNSSQTNNGDQTATVTTK